MIHRVGVRPCTISLRLPSVSHDFENEISGQVSIKGIDRSGISTARTLRHQKDGLGSLARLVHRHQSRPVVRGGESTGQIINICRCSLEIAAGRHDRPDCSAVGTEGIMTLSRPIKRTGTRAGVRTIRLGVRPERRATGIVQPCARLFLRIERRLEIPRSGHY